MKNIFNSVAFKKPATNRFDLSHDIKLSFRMGSLIPTTVMDVLPGDVVNIQVQNFLRFAPLISPVMHKVNVTTHYFFVPNRIIWPEFEKWITGESDAEAPYFELSSIPGGLQVGALGDYLGFPTGECANEVRASPLCIAAYAKIYDEYYRDQNLESDLFFPLQSGPNGTYTDIASQPPAFRAWMHDYFTSALPFAQKGDAVQIPLTTEENIPVELTPTNTPGAFTKVDGGIMGPGNVNEDSGPVPFADSVHVNSDPAVYDPRGTLTVDVQSEAVDINTLRRAFRLQEWLEKNARGGTRYVENILSHFGVKSSDARLQRPEYIGGSKQNMVISEVLATAQSADENIPVGQMAGHGISVGGSNGFRYRAEEHGFIIGIINVQPVTAYQDGLHRMHTRFDRLDYAWPTFANIGEQEVRLKELQANTLQTVDLESVFGYVPRYAEYKYSNSRVAGQMRTDLSFWHLGRIFDPNQPPPALNSDFVRCVPSNRIFAVTDPNEDNIFAHIFNNIKAVRKLPKYGIPTI